MEKQDSREEELLEQIKFCLLCKNEVQAIRLIEKYGFEQKEINIIPAYEKGLKYTEYEVVHILIKLYNDIGKKKIPNQVVLAKWFNLNKKNDK